jgi:hypothetical protein
MSSHDQPTTPAATRLLTPKKAEKLLLRELNRRYPSRTEKRVIQASWLLSDGRVGLTGDLTAIVRGVHQFHGHHCGCGATTEDLFEVDLAAGTCTCRDFVDGAAPCAHMLTVALLVQINAVERAWRAAHPEHCLRPRCSGIRMHWLGASHRLCSRCDHELRARLRRDEQERDRLDAMKWRVSQIINGRGDDTEWVAA